jgi:hypothetical protein
MPGRPLTAIPTFANVAEKLANVTLGRHLPISGTTVEPVAADLSPVALALGSGVDECLRSQWRTGVSHCQNGPKAGLA